METNQIAYEKILNLLYEYNPWWRNIDFHVPEYRTKLFYDLCTELDSPSIEIVYGPRQVGKTVLMKQVIQYLIKDEKTSPHNIMYISMDHTSIDLLCSEPVNDVIDIYLKYIRPNDPGKVYILLDEIHTINNWSSYLKQFYDLGYQFKFIVSGSSSTEIEKGSSESLIGRARLRLMLQWSFADYVSLSHFREQGKCRLNNIVEINHVIDALYQEDAKVLFNAFVKYRDALLKNDIDLEDHIIEYLVKGGYPGLQAVDFETARDILMERFGLTLHKDIMRIFAVRNIKGLENMVLRCAMQSSQLTNYYGFAKSIGIKYDTFMVYLGYLIDVFIVSESRFFSKSDSTFKKGKKLYLRDHATRNLLIGLMNRRLFEFKEEVGKTVETVVQDHACRLVYRLERRMQCYYWRGKREVDIVIKVGTVPVPIEVKYRDSPDDVAGLKEFMQEFGSKFGIVVTKDIFEVRGDVLFVPLHLFLGVC